MGDSFPLPFDRQFAGPQVLISRNGFDDYRHANLIQGRLVARSFFVARMISPSEINVPRRTFRVI